MLPRELQPSSCEGWDPPGRVSRSWFMTARVWKPDETAVGKV